MIFDALLDLILPSDCAGCGGVTGPLCGQCLAALTGPATRALPDPPPRELPPCWAVAHYDGAVRQALLAYKERSRRGLARPLGAALAIAVTGAAAARSTQQPLVIVPIPSRRTPARRRGGDHVRRLARVAAGELQAAGRRVRLAPMLTLRGSVADSAGLGAAERAANLRDAFLPRALAVPVPQGAPIVLVDDLITTGSTLAAAATALGRAGHAALGAALIAATARRRRQRGHGG